ncbi:MULTISPECIES: IMPACT family protein [Flammeovirga]|uniref:YigZ family protein n=1 Tax=Flammeovirga agarivorans TaxID=2726742 RepID=A0A7X8XVE5_9BACT|nr:MULTISPECIES: YigZ family protein [Flammeovirga]NLR91216.1 YigZ family protein [Flammeovirga agarivorans]
MEDAYLTIKGTSEGLYKEKGSKFIALAHHVTTEEEAKAIVKGYRKEYYDARHWCYAYILGADKAKYRANDDGEPSGSAGLPILGQLRSSNVTDTLVVVIRYFGGTKLGVPGLIHAYKTSAAEALELADIEEKFVQRKIKITFAYPEMNDVMKVAKQYELDFGQQSFDELCHIEFLVRESLFPQVKEKLEDVNELIFSEL